MDTAACEIERLPEELLVHVISLTSPVDACCATAVSRAFRAASDTDAVWSSFVPRELPRFAKKEISPAPTSKKALFQRLSCLPAFLPRKLMHMRLDKATGAKCFTISAEILQITKYQGYVWDWTPLGFDHKARHTDKRFRQVATFRKCGKIEIRGKIHCNMLSRNVMYAAYMVFKLQPTLYYRFDYPFQEASLCVGGRKSISQACLQSYVEDGGNGGHSPRIHVLKPSPGRVERVITLGEDMALPRRRDDGWMEVELGEFYNEEGYDGEVSVSLTETTLTCKRGLILWGIEFRNKILNPTRL